jgi:hypothetical protein
MANTKRQEFYTDLLTRLTQKGLIDAEEIKDATYKQKVKNKVSKK